MKQYLSQLIRPRIEKTGDAVKLRSYQSGQKNFSRVLKNQTINIRVEFDPNQQGPEKAAILIENLTSDTSKPTRLKLKRQSNCFEGSIIATTVGTHRFKLIYYQDKTWYWDNQSHSYFIADPKCMRDITMYTLIPTRCGSFEEWNADLSRIQSLGFNTIYLLPITQMGQSESPYAAKDLFNVDPMYFNKNDSHDGLLQFDRFVKAVNKKGMHLCLDVVLNNIGMDNTIVQDKPEWFIADEQEPDGIKRGGWSDETLWHKWNDVGALNYEHPSAKIRDELWNYMTEYALLWSGYAAETGGMIRLDNFHSSNTLFLHHVLKSIRQVYPDLIIFAELFGNEEFIEQMVLDYGINLLLATPWEHKFVPQLRDYIRYLHNKGDKLRYYFPICSHDSHSPAEEFGSLYSTIPRLLVSMLFGPGPSGIVQGVEFGRKKRIKFLGREKRLELLMHKQFSSLITSLNELIKTHDLFQVPGNLHFIDNNHNAILGAYRFDITNEQPKFLLLANLDIFQDQKIIIDTHLHHLNLAGKCLRNALNGRDEFPIVTDKLAFNLPPCGIKVIEISNAQ